MSSRTGEMPMLRLCGVDAIKLDYTQRRHGTDQGAAGLEYSMGLSKPGWEATVDEQNLLDRIIVDSKVCGGRPCIRGTRLPVAVVPDGLAEGLTADQLIDHCPQLTCEDIRAALAYGGALAREQAWKTAG